MKDYILILRLLFDKIDENIRKYYKEFGKVFFLQQLESLSRLELLKY